MIKTICSLIAFLFALGAWTAPVLAAEEPAANAEEEQDEEKKRHPLLREKLPKATQKCVFMRTLYNWKPVDRYSLIAWINNSKHAVLIELDQPCFSLPFAETIAFTSNADGRLCSWGGDAVIVDGDRCTIGAINDWDLKTKKIKVKEAKAAPGD